MTEQQYETIAASIATVIWEISTGNGRDLDEELHYDHMQNCRAAVANSYADSITVEAWQSAALAQVGGSPQERFATGLNDAGQAHVAAELDRLGLDWSVSGTCSEIEGKPGFMALTSGGSYDYEISNIDAGKRSYGVFGWIEILADKHVVFEVCE